MEAVDGLAVTSQNRWPSLRFDLGAVNDLVSPLLGAGFYYKTFMWPPSFWTKVYEPRIRAAAGLGRAPDGPDPDRYANRHAHCEVLVVGAGPAGLAAALAASEGEARVILADEGAELGGSLLHDATSQIDGLAAGAWAADALARLAARPHVTLLSRTTAFGYYNANHLALAERLSDHLAAPGDRARERLWQVRAREVVLATGAHERPLVFPDNDRPGIMLAESLRVYANRYAVVPGRRVVVATSSASAYRVAADLRAAGREVTLVDVRPEAAIGPDLASLRAVGVTALAGHTILGSTGRRRVTGLVVAPVGPDGAVGPRRTLACDLVGMSGGWTPAVHLASQSRGSLRFAPDLDAFVPDRSVQAERSAGAARGTYDLASCLAEGHAAGAEAAGAPVARTFEATPTATGFLPAPRLPSDRDPRTVRAFVDFQNDVTAKDIGAAVGEGFRSVEHVKRYTTTGMATDQGKTSNMNALGLLAATLDRPVPAVGTTTFRPPYTPVTFGTLIGPGRDALFEPVRETPIHGWAAEHGALFEDVGAWRRALAFPRAGESLHDAVARECRAVREAVGIFDATTLGKIEVVGPDAAEFLGRIYVNALARLAPGACRYGLMLKEDGYVLDDGIVARLAPDRFHLTTTTGGAARVLAHMEDYLQTEWPELRVALTSVTEQYAVIALQGPASRTLLEPLVEGIDLAEAAFPHMGVRTGRVLGVPCRLFRVSFTGELGYEVNVPSDHGRPVWEALIERGRALGITPYGTDAMHVLRAERGFVIVGQETDGTVTPDDLGLAGMIGKTKRDFVGKRSLARPGLVAEGRKQLVGLLTDDPALVLDEGAQIVTTPEQPVPMRMLGHVTSSYASPACGRSIALALVAGGRTRIGETLHATTPGGFAAVRVVRPVFLEDRNASPASAVPGSAGDLRAETRPDPSPAGEGESAKPNRGGVNPGRAVPTPDRSPDQVRGSTRPSPPGRDQGEFPRTGLHGADPVRLTPLPPAARWVLRLLDPGDSTQAGPFAIGQPVLRLAEDGPRLSARLGPDEWLLIAPEDEADAVARAVADGLGGRVHSLVDVGHRQVAIEVAGPGAASVLNAGCPLDLALPACPVGFASRTLLGKAEIVLMRLEPDRFRVECWRSFAPYVAGFLAEAARDAVP